MVARVIATAGHVDHGKSTLVRALTGTDPDRLEEERRRGLTIDLGFAWTTLPSGHELAFVDVPGHVRFLKNMLTGVGSVEACLFVVAATDGWKPQSEEHLRILELLGLTRGIVALTKVAGIDEDVRALARLDVEEHLIGTFLEPAPIVEVDIPAGVGHEDLVGVLEELVESLPELSDGERPRVWIDRCFPVQGSGTVVTGSLAGGRIVQGDHLEVVPGRGADHAPLGIRVRSLQAQGRTVDSVLSGRVALNLIGVSHHEIERGQALVRPAQWEPTQIFDASLTVLAALGREVGRKGAYRLHIGAAQHPVSLRVLGGDTIECGRSGAVRIHLPIPLPLLPGDRYVLREAGRGETVGGGEVLDISPVRRARDARPDRSVDRVVAERGVIEAALLERLTGERRPADVGGRWVTDPTWRAAAESSLRETIKGAEPFGLEVARLDDLERALLDEMAETIVVSGRAHRLSEDISHRAPLDDHSFVRALDEHLFDPPSPQECSVSREEVRVLVSSGHIVESDGLYFSSRAIERAARVIASLLAEKPEGVTTSEIRQALGTSRKYVLPLLTRLDEAGITRRRGDLRVQGPRLEQASASRTERKT